MLISIKEITKNDLNQPKSTNQAIAKQAIPVAVKSVSSETCGLVLWNEIHNQQKLLCSIYNNLWPINCNITITLMTSNRI